MVDNSIIIFDNDPSYSSNPFHVCEDYRLSIPSQLSKKWPLSSFLRNRTKASANGQNGSNPEDSNRRSIDLDNEIGSILTSLQNSEVTRSSEILLKNQIEATKMWKNNMSRSQNKTKSFVSSDGSRQEKLVLPKSNKPFVMKARTCLPQVYYNIAKIINYINIILAVICYFCYIN